MNCSGASREILKTESTIKTASRRRPFSPASPVPICDQCCASSIRSVIQHGKSLRTRCEQAMARRNSANSISANRRFSRGWRGILLRPGRGRVGDNYDFGRHHKVLDVAGGTGSFLVAVLKGHANLRGTLFELPGPVPSHGRSSRTCRRVRGSTLLRAMFSRTRCLPTMMR
jgi:hypothetical protein